MAANERAVRFEAVRDFIIDNWSTAMTWKPELFEGWIRWHANNESLILVTDDDRLTGLAIVRRVSDTEVTDNGYEQDPEGPLYFLDLVIAENTQTMRALALAIIERFGYAPFVALKHDGQVRVHQSRKVIKALRSKKHEFTVTPIATASA